MKLSVIMPAFNEKEYIETIVSKVLNVKLPDGLERELIIVDDCSTDGTTDILRTRVAAAAAPVRVYYHERNQGKGAALRTGFRHASGDLWVIQDADLEYDPADWPAMLAPILEGRADIVYGSRFHGAGSEAFYGQQYLGNKIVFLALKTFFGIRLSDPEVCYKMFRSEVLKQMDLETDDYGFEVEFTIKAARARKWRICEVPIRYLGRTYEQGKKIRFRDGLKALWYILKFRFQPGPRRGSQRPLRLRGR